MQTLLDGVTIGGHKLHDQEITLNQSSAWKKIFSDVESNRFTITKEKFSKEVIEAIAKDRDNLLGVTEIMKKYSISKASIYRLTNSLVNK